MASVIDDNDNISARFLMHETLRCADVGGSYASKTIFAKNKGAIYDWLEDPETKLAEAYDIPSFLVRGTPLASGK